MPGLSERHLATWNIEVTERFGSGITVEVSLPEFKLKHVFEFTNDQISEGQRENNSNWSPVAEAVMRTSDLQGWSRWP